MAKFSIPKDKHTTLAGIVTIAAALVLLIVTALMLRQCGAETPKPSGTLGTLGNHSPLKPIAANPYDAGDFAYRKGYLTCISGPSLLGVDVSSHQGAIDWPKVASQGISFAMVRLGYRGWGNGELVADELAQTNLQQAQASGLQIGAYFYSQAISVEEAQEEARYVLTLLDGQALSMPVVFDWEIFSQSGRNAQVDSLTLNACAMAFCQIIADAGYSPMVYFNMDIGNRMLDLSALQQAGYGFWLALYTDMTYPHRVDMWQYTQTGRVPGIDTSVDLNLYFTYGE